MEKKCTYTDTHVLWSWDEKSEPVINAAVEWLKPHCAETAHSRTIFINVMIMNSLSVNTDTDNIFNFTLSTVCWITSNIWLYGENNSFVLCP